MGCEGAALHHLASAVALCLCSVSRAPKHQPPCVARPPAGRMLDGTRSASCMLAEPCSRQVSARPCCLHMYSRGRQQGGGTGSAGCRLFQALPPSQMVAPHTTPLFVSAWRLLPAGVLLVAWGASPGRSHPATPAAWGSIALFALVDATCFQVPPQWRTSQAGLLRRPALPPRPCLHHRWRPGHCLAADKHIRMRPCIRDISPRSDRRCVNMMQS